MSSRIIYEFFISYLLEYFFERIFKLDELFPDINATLNWEDIAGNSLPDDKFQKIKRGGKYGAPNVRIPAFEKISGIDKYKLELDQECLLDNTIKVNFVTSLMDRPFFAILLAINFNSELKLFCAGEINWYKYLTF